MSTLYTKHVYGICPAVNVVAVNSALLAAGHGTNNFRVPLNGDGSTKAASNYGTHWAMTEAVYTQLSTDPTLSLLGVTWDATRGKVGDSDTRESEWLASAGVQKQKQAASKDAK